MAIHSLAGGANEQIEPSCKLRGDRHSRRIPSRLVGFCASILPKWNRPVRIRELSAFPQDYPPFARPDSDKFSKTEGVPEG
jgi:hypothetical protein